MSLVGVAVGGVRVLQGWSLEKLGGDEESRPRGHLMEWPGAGAWPPVGVVFKSVDEVAKRYPDKKFLQKLDKEVDFSKNILLRYSWTGFGPPVNYRVLENMEGPVLVFTANRLERLQLNPGGSLELIIPTDVYKRSIERDRAADFLFPH